QDSAVLVQEIAGLCRSTVELAVLYGRVRVYCFSTPTAVPCSSSARTRPDSVLKRSSLESIPRRNSCGRANQIHHAQRPAHSAGGLEQLHGGRSCSGGSAGPVIHSS